MNGDVTPAMDRKMKKIAGTIAATFLILFAAVAFRQWDAERHLAVAGTWLATRPPSVDVAAVRSATAGHPLTLPGETAAWYESTIYARVNGYVAKWLVDIGDHVRGGQVLAVIDTPELDAELVAAKAKFKAAQADVTVREAEADFARSTYARWRDSPKGVVSEQEREDKKSGDATAAARLAAAKAQVALDQADVDRLTAFEQFKQVTAPYGGTIIERRIDIGNLVTAGSSTGTTPLYRMVKDDPIRIFVDAPQSSAGDLMKVGVPATIGADSVPGRHFDGKIARTAEAVNPQARTIRLEVDLPNPDHALVPGMYVEVGFQLPGDGLRQVPAAALQFRSGGPQVAVVDGDGIVHFRDVTIVRDDGNVVELGSGVAAGDQVVLNLSSQITDGEKVATIASPAHLASSAAVPR